jgi:hypothetical protein
VVFGAHVCNLNCDIVANAGTPFLDFDDYTVQPRTGSPTQLDTEVEQFLGAIAPLFRTDVDLGPVELYKVTVTDLGGGEFTVEKDFWAAYTPTANAGTSSSATQRASQVILSTITAEGGTHRFELLDTIIQPTVEATYPTGVTAVDNLWSGEIFGTSAWILGKDTSYPRVPSKYLPGQNERLWKKINRSNT